MEKFNDRLRKKYNELSKGLKIAAKYIADYPKDVAFQTAKNVGTASNTSETTVIRLCYELGYSGYSELQKEIQMSLLEQTAPHHPIEDYRSSSKTLKDTNLIQYIIDQDTSSVRATLEKLDFEEYKKAVELLISSDKRVVVGFRSSYGPANWLMFSLNIVVGDTYLYRGEIEGANQYLSKMDEKTTIIAISFRRYTQESVSFVKAAKKRGAKVIAITDDEFSPVGQIADIILRVYAPNPVSLKGMTPLFSVLNLLVTSVAVSEEPKIQQRMKDYEQMNE
jgi:DNA-binding MurR/RpiR family transcriptional regulator